MSHAAPATPPVPERYRGVWARTLLQVPAKRPEPGPDRAPDAGPRPPPPVRDLSTWVRWLQTAHWHADLRVPATARPAAGRRLFDGESAARLAAQQGHFGRTTVEQLPAAAEPDPGAADADGEPQAPALPLPAVEVCTWHRQLDVQPPGAHTDAGSILFDNPDRLIETGLHGDYLEVWERLPDTVGRSLVLEMAAHAEGQAAIWWLLAGGYLMRVRPRAAAWPADTAAGDTLASLLQRHPDAGADLLDFEISAGRLRGGLWTIERSTLPPFEGQVESFSVRRVSETQAVVFGCTVQTGWRVREWEGAGPVVE